MIDSLVIAWKYLRFNKAKAATIVACVSLIAVLPLALQQLLGESERQLLSRAVTTPLVIGAKGSSLDLVMNSIYFGDEVPELIDMGAAEEIWDSGLATAIPLGISFYFLFSPPLVEDPGRHQGFLRAYLLHAAEQQ